MLYIYSLTSLCTVCGVSHTELRKDTHPSYYNNNRKIDQWLLYIEISQSEDTTTDIVRQDYFH